MDTERMIKYWRGWEWIGRFEVEIMKIGEKKWDENLLYQLISAFSSSLINVKKTQPQYISETSTMYRFVT